LAIDPDFLFIVDKVIVLQGDTLKLKIGERIHCCAISRVKVAPAFEVQDPGVVVS
jgi:hypothetical protein